MAMKKPITKQWWFWVIVAIFAIGIIGNLGNNGNSTGTSPSPSISSEVVNITPSPDVDVDVTAYEEAIVTRNIDGDTIEIERQDGSIAKVRFIGIDTPESTIQHEEYGEEAALFTALTIPQGTTIYLEKDVSETDKYDRLLRYVWLEEPTDGSDQEIRTKMLNAILVLEGYANASTYPPDVKYSDFFAQCETEAESANVGLWALVAETVAPTVAPTSVPTPEPAPSENAESIAPVSDPDPTAAPAPDNPQYCASSKSDKFHHLGCRYVDQILPENMVHYNTREEAIADGKEPCGVCKP